MEPPGPAAKTKTVDAAFARRLREALSHRGVRKLYPLALEIGVDESALSRWRQGQPISLDNAVRLAVRLDISLDWLLIGRGSLNEHRRTNAPIDPLVERLRRLPPDAISPLMLFLDAMAPARDG